MGIILDTHHPTCAIRQETAWKSDEIVACVCVHGAQAFPEAVQAKDDEDWFPFNCLMLSSREPTDPLLVMSASLLEVGTPLWLALFCFASVLLLLFSFSLFFLFVLLLGFHRLVDVVCLR